MATFKFTKEEAQTRAQILARIVQLNDKDNKLVYKLYKQLRLKDEVSNDDAYAYYRQLDEYVSAANA